MILRSLLIAATPYLEYTSNSRGLSRILEPQPRSGFILDFTLTSGTRPLGLAMCVCVCGMISDVCVCVGVGVGVGLGVGVGVSVGVGVWNDFRGVCMCVWRVCGMTSEVCVCVCGVLLEVCTCTCEMPIGFYWTFYGISQGIECIFLRDASLIGQSNIIPALNMHNSKLKMHNAFPSMSAYISVGACSTNRTPLHPHAGDGVCLCVCVD